MYHTGMKPNDDEPMEGIRPHDHDPNLFEQQRHRMTAAPSVNTEGPRRLSYQHMAVGFMAKHRETHFKEWSQERIFLELVMESTLYSLLMGFVIVINAVLVIHETDLRAAEGKTVPEWIDTASYTFLGVYSLEILVRLFVHRMLFFRNSWNLLDLTVVLVDICAEVAKAFGLDDLPSISILRIFRLMRLVRLVAMLAVFQELQTMLLGFGSAMKAMIWASMMIGVVVTVCSIIAVTFIHPLNQEVAKTGAYDGCGRCGRAFETVAESNLTFIQQIIAGDSWGTITIPIIEAYPAAGVFFLIVFGIIDLGVINLVLMVIVNAAESAREANLEMAFRKKVAQIEEMKLKLKHLCQDLDDNQDGRISLEEFLQGCDGSPELRKTLAILDIQRQDAEIIYHLMDDDRSGDVDFNEFVGTMVATKHESLSTKLLFLKASMHKMEAHLTQQALILEQGIASKMMRTEEVAGAVQTAFDETSAKMGLRWDRIMEECQGLTQALNQRWDQLQREQAKNYQMLERVAGDMMSPPTERSTWLGGPGSRESTLLSLPKSCEPCQAAPHNKHRIGYGPPPTGYVPPNQIRPLLETGEAYTEENGLVLR